VTEAVTRLSLALADQYRIERELGAGGIATIYFAQDLRHDRKVAIKLMRPNWPPRSGPSDFSPRSQWWCWAVNVD
jgi:hypothetical protein